MPDTVIYFRGFPPVDRVDALLHNAEALDDLKVVAGLTAEQISNIRVRLEAATGFLDPNMLTAVVREVVSDDAVARAVHRILRNIKPINVQHLLNALSSRLSQADAPFDQTTLKGLQDSLSILVQPYPAMERFAKAERLSDATGQQLECLDLICDLRPIFDERRERLEGMMPYTRLVVVATGTDGLPNSFEAELTHEQVIDLVDKATKARIKLELLRTSIESWLPDGLPDVAMTRVSRRESTDA